MSRSPAHFKRTLVDLEDWVNKTAIEDFKIDACVDRFLVRVYRLNRSILDQLESSSYYGFGRRAPKKHPKPLEWSGEGAEELREIASELRDNLNRLLPGYVEENTDVLGNEKVLRKINSRWEAVGSRVACDREYLQQTSDKDRLVETGLAWFYLRFVETITVAIERETSSALFTCGGSIPIANPIGSEQVLHWGAEHDSTAQKLTLPVLSENSDGSTHGLQTLLDACQPASFGRGGQDILDPEYRRAGKLDPDRFLTSFHPADFGIIELIEQILLPGISGETENRLQFRKLKAELYKLNVYSGPSGHFRKHVDTPRSEHQIGSLVVCLPCQFEGGNLTVQHHGQMAKFEWSRQSSSSIQWAAFYSDCEHEIETIRAGHRITLTYNLYVREMPGAILAPIRPVLDPHTLPLYGLIESLLTTPGFMKDGGVFGVHCSHAYPHSSDIAGLQLPRSSKGADLVVYAVFEALGMDVSILPVLEYDEDYEGNGAPYFGDSEQDSASEQDSDSGRGWYYKRKYWRSVPKDYLARGKESSLRYSEVYPWKSSSALLDEDQHWKRLLLTREVVDVIEAFSFGEKHHLPKKPNSLYEEWGVRVPPHLRRYIGSERGQEEDLKEVTNDVWPSYYPPGITWLVEAKHKEMAFSHISYDNQASIGARYSCAVILAVIPPFSQRGQSGKMK
ncbi:oxidoreductase [Aspergillus eucalypticola CBS 122712]|uniref:Oxidoreductase n=1 Tax=Aspergillus eucalypticola (strain CBS 122712 / IBT 29274) TaxID=1448314 RepID=A0A317V9A9_ASPEC|nr:oxidoreductase [Aspergillus eucalypticola CBS 122712]PWY70746.1 oxidoreductase [Aspergillus eucalypticola CBS 122712]